MAKRELERMTIIPGENGGHVVEHEYSRGSSPKGMPAYEPPEKHPFGPKDDYKLTAHISKTLGLKDAKEEAEEAKPITPEVASGIRAKAMKGMK